MQDIQPPPLAEISRDYGLDAVAVEPLGSGLINNTFLVGTSDDRRCVLQRLHPVFSPVVNEDIETVTRHLEARGMATPRLLRTVSDRLWVERQDGIWRMMSFVAGATVERVETAAMAREAGHLLGRFHAALADLDISLAAARPAIHDLHRHLDALKRALVNHRRHSAYPAVRPLADAILAAAETLRPLPPLPTRMVHGDPKISNFIFDPDSGAGICMVDLDTLNRMPLPLELGDAFRSWCNPAGEDTPSTGFSASRFRAALAGYADAAGPLISVSESRCLVDATLAIMVELAARFCADALNESYFGWDPARFPSRSEHNRVRAQGQLAAWRAAAEREGELSAIVEETLPGTDG